MQEMGYQNRKATKNEMAHVRRVIAEAYPDLKPVFGGHSAYGGHRAPRDHTISFRLLDQHGKYHSNVIWLMPDCLAKLTADDIRAQVAQSNGERK
jgi:hypothetical protein